MSPYLSVAATHELYLKEHEPIEYEKLQRNERINPVVKYYHKYFNTNFNLPFGTPKTDTCTTCDQQNVKICDSIDGNEKRRFQEEKKVHLRQAQQFYTKLRTSTQMAKDSEGIAAILNRIFHFPTFQMGKFSICARFGCIFLEYMTVVAVMQLHVCTVWPENVAHKGSNEVVSYLDSFLSGLNGIKWLNLFSNSCVGQNKTVIQYLYTLVRNGCFHHFSPFEGTPSYHVTETLQKLGQRDVKLKECIH